MQTTTMILEKLLANQKRICRLEIRAAEIENQVTDGKPETQKRKDERIRDIEQQICELTAENNLILWLFEEKQ